MPILDPFNFRKPFVDRRPRKRNREEITVSMLLTSKVLREVKELISREIPKCVEGKGWMKCNILPQSMRSAVHLCKWIMAYDNTMISETRAYGIAPSQGAKRAGYSQLQEVWIGRRYPRDYVKDPLPRVQVLIDKAEELGI